MSTPESGPAARLFQCTTCSRSFTRADHLTRHVRAHTRQKPYVCPTCSKGFARIDLLKRHAAAHEADSTDTRKRRGAVRPSRVAQACEACSQHHLRCEDHKPCSRCRKKNIDCKFSFQGNSVSEDVQAVRGLLDLSDDTVPFHLSTEIPDGGTDDLDMAPYVQPSVASETHPSRAKHSMTTPDTNFQQYSVDSMAHDAFSQDAIPAFHQFTAMEGQNEEHIRSLLPFGTPFPGNTTPRGLLDTSFNWDLSLNDIDVAFLDQYNLDIPFNVETPITDPQSTERRASILPHEGVEIRHEAFKRSIWRYLPRSDRDFGTAEERNLALVDSEGSVDRRSQLSTRRAIQEHLSRATRDKVFALVLGACTESNVGRIASAFPSTELLDGLVQYFLTSPSLSAGFWFHLPTFSPSEEGPVLIALVIAAGAVSTPDVSLRKLGFALHEAGRLCSAKTFEDDNTAIRDLPSLRNLMLQLDIGIWSGISRKMEIAESFLQPLVTMIRRRGSFRSSAYTDIGPHSDDDGEHLHDKWKRWIAQESRLRLIYHMFEHDRQSSMALLKPPLISYSEMQLPIPNAENLWRASNAASWKEAYFASSNPPHKRPSPLDCLLDLNCLHDYERANTIYLYMLWGMIWEYRQMAAVTAKIGSHHRNSLILPSRHQELTKSLEDYRINCPAKEGNIVLELMFIHLNAPLEDIQLFAGIDGHFEARQAYPSLTDWVSTASARQSLWHAGQILRWARLLSQGRLCNFEAIAVYHAGLILWGYSFVKQSMSSSAHDLPRIDVQPVLLDDDHNIGIQRFITLERGLAAIQSSETQGAPIPISAVDSVLDSLVGLFHTNHGMPAAGSLPPLVENLVQLIQGLGSFPNNGPSQVARERSGHH